MKSEVVPVEIKGVMPTANGCAVFLGPEEKTFVIYIESQSGAVLKMTLDGEKRQRPLTHDLMQNVFLGFGVEVERVVINHVDKSTFFARLTLKMNNELGTKILELDARPSDCMILASQAGKPIFVTSNVLETVDDMSEILERLLKQEE